MTPELQWAIMMNDKEEMSRIRGNKLHKILEDYTMRVIDASTQSSSSISYTLGNISQIYSAFERGIREYPFVDRFALFTNSAVNDMVYYSQYSTEMSLLGAIGRLVYVDEYLMAALDLDEERIIERAIIQIPTYGVLVPPLRLPNVDILTKALENALPGMGKGTKAERKEMT